MNIAAIQAPGFRVQEIKNGGNNPGSQKTEFRIWKNQPSKSKKDNSPRQRV